MAYWWCSLVAGLGASMLVAKFFSTEIPVGVSEPYLCRLFVMMWQLQNKMSDIVHYLGFNHVSFDRYMSEITVTLEKILFGKKDKFSSFYTDDGIRVGLFEPPNAPDPPGRAIIYYHGGGFVSGSIESCSGVASRLARDLNCRVFVVGYRLSPEHLFPAGLEDCLCATKQIISNAAVYNINPQRVAIMGDSAGGALAASVVVALRDEAITPAIKLQVLIYPVLQLLTTHTPSMIYHYHTPMLPVRRLIHHKDLYFFGSTDHYDLFRNGNFLKAMSAEFVKKHFDIDYLPNDEIKKSYSSSTSDSITSHFNATFWDNARCKLLDPRASPLFVENLSNLPLTYISSCHTDPLRDDAYFFEKRLVAAGTEVVHEELHSCFHVWLSTHSLFSTFDLYFKDIIQFIDTHL